MSSTLSEVDCSVRDRLIRIRPMYNVERHFCRLLTGFSAHPGLRLFELENSFQREVMIW